MEESNNQQINMPKKPTKKEKAEKAGKDLGEVAATAAGNYFGGPVGGMVANKIAQSKLGQQTLGQAADVLAKNPVTKNALAKTQPVIEKAKPVLNAAASNMGGSSSGANPVGNSSSSNSTSSPSTNKPNSNSNNSGFGSDKSGLFSSKNPSSSNEGSSAVDSAKGAVEAFKKAKKIIGIISAVAPIAFPIIVAFLIVVVIMAQIMTIRDNITQLAQQFTTGVEKLINFAQGDGWMTNEEYLFSYLDKQYKLYSTTAGGAQLDVPLIAATIHYSTMVDFEQYEQNTATDDTSYDTDDFENLGNALTKDQTSSFYRVAKDKLGSVNTLVPGQKRLLGHVAKTKVIVAWVNPGAALGYWARFAGLYSAEGLEELSNVIGETINLANPLGFINAYNYMKAYYDQTGSVVAGLKYDAANVWYELGEFISIFGKAYHSIAGTYDSETGSQSEISVDSINAGDLSDTEKYIPLEDRDGLIRIPVPYVVLEENYGYEEYKQMKTDLMNIKVMLNQNGIDYSGDKQALEKAKDSSDEELNSLYKSYKSSELNYEYSYTHYLQNLYIPFTYFYGEDYTQQQIDSIVEEIFDQRDFYNYLIGEDFNYSCGGSCVYNVNGQQIDNLKVRLMQCSDGTLGEPILGEELVDFEKYILGVVYAEIGPDAPVEAAKVQAIAARSYALTRPKAMGNAAGLSLKKEADGWVLSIRNCTEDQVYCDPDKGCSNTTDPSKSGNGTTVYSGANTKAYKYKGPLAADAKIRSAVSAVSGQVLLDGDGNIVKTGYVNSNQEKWASQANAGMDHTEILLAEYTNGSTISSSNCSKVCNQATGDYTQWKQLASLGAPWAGTVIGSGKTIGDIGCLATSVAMQIARSGVPLQNINGEFNPGTFVEAIKPNGFVTSSGAPGGTLFVWGITTKVAPNFVHQGATSLSGLSQSNKAAKIQDLINQGCYLVMEVKGGSGGEHWVAVDYVQGNSVYMMDPASTETTAWVKYPQAWTTQVHCYKVTS